MQPALARLVDSFRSLPLTERHHPARAGARARGL